MTFASEGWIREQSDESSRSTGSHRPRLDVTPECWEPELRRRLRQAPPNLEALRDLYDRVAPAAYGYARQRTRSRRQAREAVLSAFVEAARHPAVFDDARIAMRIQLLLLVHVRTS